jgi:acyl-CoA synthetase (AMP-forming)/AMP-acid ligase II
VTTPTQWNLADLFEAVCDAVPDRTAVVAGDRRLTFRELDERATRLAHHLAANGVQAGDHVGLYLYNGSEYVEGLFAAYKLRAVPINVNYRYVEAELRYLFDNADLVALVHGREFVPRIAAVKGELPKLKVFVAVEDGTDEDLGAIGATEYEAALAGASAERDFAERSEDDLYILYTGGTTGMPKGVMWTQKDFFLSTIAPLIGMSGGEADTPAKVVENAINGGGSVAFPVPPLMHGAALWVSIVTVMAGNTLVLTAQRKMDAHEIWRIVEREKVMTVTIVGDAMARPLMDALEDESTSYDISSLFLLGSGGAMLSPAMKERMAAALPNVIVADSIGASETGYQGTFAGADDEGRPRFMMGDHTTVLDEDNRPVEPGRGIVGRLARGGYVPIGYYKDPEKTASVFAEADGKRWVLPGDMAMVEADGMITLLGRGSVSINTGGEKVFPEEVENALKSHDAVFDVVVVGVPDERWGERVVAVVKATEGMSPSVDDLAEHARRHIAGYKVPREVHIVDEVVRSPSGKADYRWAKRVATGEQ